MKILYQINQPERIWMRYMSKNKKMKAVKVGCRRVIARGLISINHQKVSSNEYDHQKKR